MSFVANRLNRFPLRRMVKVGMSSHLNPNAPSNRGMRPKPDADDPELVANSLKLLSRDIKYTTGRCLTKGDVITINHRHRDSLQFVLPQLAFVKVILHSLSLIE